MAKNLLQMLRRGLVLDLSVAFGKLFDLVNNRSGYFLDR